MNKFASRALKSNVTAATSKEAIVVVKDIFAQTGADLWVTKLVANNPDKLYDDISIKCSGKTSAGSFTFYLILDYQDRKKPEIYVDWTDTDGVEIISDVIQTFFPDQNDLKKSSVNKLIKYAKSMESLYKDAAKQASEISEFLQSLADAMERIRALVLKNGGRV